MAATQYGIGVTKNRFELFDDDEEDPLEVLKKRELENEARKKTKLSEKENKGKEAQTKSKAVPPRKGIKETQNLKPTEAHKAGKEDKTRVTFRTERPERKFNPDNNREEKNNRRNRPDRPIDNNAERPERFERREFRGGERPAVGAGGQAEGGPSGGTDVRGGRGRGGGQRGGFNGRGGRGGRGGQRPPYDGRGKREYDRQSGSDKTGVKSIDKREGSGAHNWGNHKDDLEDMQEGNQPQNTEDPVWWNNPEKNEEGVTENGGNAPEGEENVHAPTEEEPRELTLDEWKALKAPRQKPTYNLRKAGEGEDLSQWKKMYALQKKKEEEEEEEDEYEYEEYPQRVGRQKHILDIDIHFKDTRGGGRGRGGRGTGRGGPRMGTRAAQNPAFVEKNVFNNSPKLSTTQAVGREMTMTKPREPKSAPKVDDEHDFPSLG